MLNSKGRSGLNLAALAAVLGLGFMSPAVPTRRMILTDIVANMPAGPRPRPPLLPNRVRQAAAAAKRQRRAEKRLLDAAAGGWASSQRCHWGLA